MLVLAACCATVAGVVIASGSTGPHPSGIALPAEPASAITGAPAALPRSRTVRLVERATGQLAAPVQDAAAASLPGGALLLGGLSAADSSRSDIRLVRPAGDRGTGQLPTALHDTSAVRLGGAVYLFGGGTGASTQSDAIVRISLAGNSATAIGHLPSPSSDQAAAAVRGTAYVVGGYTGAHWLSTIVAWRPGAAARVVANLPFGLRYAAVAAAGDRLVIAGGTLADGSASRAVFTYSPPAAHVTRVADLPSPTTHAAAASIGGIAYVIGGRGPALGTPTDRIVAVDASTGRVRAAGRLTSPRSDLAAVPLGGRILLAGGRSADATEAGLSVLAPATRRSVAAAAFAAFAPARSAAGVYAHDGANQLSGAARFAKPLVYVPNSQANTVDVIDPKTYRIVGHFPVGGLPQHVVPAWDLRTLYVTNDTGNSLTPINPRTGKPAGAPIPVDDPYNMYFTPNGRYAIVVAERLHRLDFRAAHGFALHHSLSVPCTGVDHIDFTADGRRLLASCEFTGQLVVVNVAAERVVRTINLPDGRQGMPQDVKLSPDGRIFYVADMHANGVWEIDARSFRVLRFLHTGTGAHGLYPSRDARLLYVTNRGEGSVSVIRFRTRKVIAKWRIPHGSPDMGGVSADGKVLWLSGRYSAEVYAISTRTGKLLARIRVGAGPHGLSVWPQPGRYSLGHTGILR